MTINKAKEVLGKDAEGFTDEDIQSWIYAAEGLTEVFYGQLEQGLFNKSIDNEQVN